MTQNMVVVTGGAGGIGAATAAILVSRGYSVALLDWAEEALEAEAELLRTDGATVVTLPIDVRSQVDVTEGITDAARHSRLTGLVHTAGVFDIGTIADVDEDGWDRLLDIKLKAAYVTSKVAIPLIAEAGGGSIVHIASQSGRTKSMFTAPNYGAANGGIIGLTMTLAAQSARHNVRVNAIAPGMIRTPMLEPYRRALGDEAVEAIPASIPLGRFGEPGEIGEVAAFLLSDGASYITGETINVNGGTFMM